MALLTHRRLRPGRLGLFVGIAGASLAWLAAAAHAQTAPAPPRAPAAAPAPRPAAPASPATTITSPGVPSDPDVTTASFGDWLLRCQRGEESGKPVRVCEIVQSMQVQGQAQPVAQFAIGRVSARAALDVTAVLPVNVAFPSTVRVLVGDADATGVELSWRRCLPGACFAQASARDDALKRWRAATEPGRIVFRSGAGQDGTLPLSFRGLGQALDALAKEGG